MTVICSLIVMLATNSQISGTELMLQGTVLAENDLNYLVDFSKEIKQHKNVKTPDIYNRTSVAKDACFKVGKK